MILVRHEETAADAEPPETLNTHFRLFDRPMGVCEKDGRLSIGGTNTVWEYRNVPGCGAQAGPARETRCVLRAAQHSLHRQHRHSRNELVRRRSALAGQYAFLVPVHAR